MENHQDCCLTVGDVLAHTVVQALEEKEEQLDQEIHRLENMKEDEMEEMRRKRLEKMKSSAMQNAKLRAQGHGVYSEIADEKEFFDVAKKSKVVICHFYRPTTWRCQIIDKHLNVLAQLHVEARFVKINIEKSPYLADKLRIVMLPTIMLIKDGKTEHSIIGFDELGGTDEFATEDLEEVLVTWGCVKHRQ
jgi:Thioredoxin